MDYFGFFLFVILEWMLGVPVIFHALNGGRLILYESFGNRNDDLLIRWVLGLSVVYMLLMGIMMILANQEASPIFFWLFMLVTGFSLILPASAKIWRTKNSYGWRLHRITGVYLLVMVPAHFLFMHLHPANSHVASVVIARMQNLFIKFVDLTLVVSALYHGGFGVISIARDYVESKMIQTALALLAILILVAFAGVGIGLILKI